MTLRKSLIFLSCLAEKKDGLKGFFWPRQPYKDQDAVLKVQNALKSAIAKLGQEI